MGELQHKLLEALFPLTSAVDSIAEGDWFLIPDNSTRILEKYDSSAHPGFIPDGGLVDPFGIVAVWIRSASLRTHKYQRNYRKSVSATFWSHRFKCSK